MNAQHLVVTCLGLVSLSWGADVEPQPFLAATQRLIDATNFLGTPFSAEEIATLKDGIRASDSAAVSKVQSVLDAHALFHVTITPEQRVKVAAGAAKPVLDEAGVTARLVAGSPQAKEAYVKGSPPVVPNVKPKDPGEPALSTRWLDLQMFEAEPMRLNLSGLAVEYRIIQL
jgi:hypothetical protein